MVGESIFSIIQGLFEGGNLKDFFNKALLVLITKVESPKFVSQRHPIRLCMILYNILTKVIVNKLKLLMPKLVGLEQTSFVAKRYIMDNFTIIHEVIHSMRY